MYFVERRSMFELYDLETDPNEMKNLAGKSRSIEKELRAAFQEWMILQRDFVPLPVSLPAKKKDKR